jgi:hypothetical protein
MEQEIGASRVFKNTYLGNVPVQRTSELCLQESAVRISSRSVKVFFQENKKVVIRYADLMTTF